MSSDEEEQRAAGTRFFTEDCPECGTPGPERVLSTVNGCRICMEGNPVPVHTPKRFDPTGWRVNREQRR